MSTKNLSSNHKSGTSYHASLDHCLYLPGLGHVAPDTYSGYGSLLDSDLDDDNEATSAFNADVNTFVPDSVIESVPDYVQKVDDVAACGRSGDLSPSSRRFNQLIERSVERQRKREEKRDVPDILVDGVVEEKLMLGESQRSADLSPKSKGFKRFCDKYLHKGKKT
ncbi:uncharacterized protein LOC141591387 [Silene latifolia]|uniref:uncharacterized protein LOC141591387 n=1 Tax=Silene latifolia TaxID=37657 RepID=UPI003D782DEB